MKVILRVLKGIVTTFLVIVLLVVIFQKVTNNKLAIGNIYIFQVVSDSMVPEYKIGDIIVVQKVPASNIKIDDDVTYLGKEVNLKGLIVTHRVIREREEEGTKYFVTKGIANQIEDPEISQEDIYGKVVYHTLLFSFVGRLMTNIVIYYLLFVAVGVAFAYEIVTSFILKDDDDKEDIKDEE